MYGYFYIEVYKNPNRELVSKKIVRDYYVNSLKHYLVENYEPDWILYDYLNKPSNPVFKSYLDMILKYAKNNNTIVVLSLFQLGKTKVDIYKVLSRMRAKQVRLVVIKWEVDISSTMKKVLELSVDDLAVYENIQLHKNHCSNYSTEDNTYRKLAGYMLNERYISNETYNRII